MRLWILMSGCKESIIVDMRRTKSMRVMNNAVAKCPAVRNFRRISTVRFFQT